MRIILQTEQSDKVDITKCREIGKLFPHTYRLFYDKVKIFFRDLWFRKIGTANESFCLHFRRKSVQCGEAGHQGGAGHVDVLPVQCFNCDCFGSNWIYRCEKFTDMVRKYIILRVNYLEKLWKNWINFKSWGIGGIRCVRYFM